MKNISLKKAFIATLTLILILACFGGCAAKDDTVINIATIKGPTGMGMVHLMDSESFPQYNITLASAPDEAVAQFVSDSANIAAVPINVAGVLYNKLEGNVQMLAVNTYGVMYLLSNSTEINTFSDLEGKTIYLSGQGSTPEYIINYLIEANGLTGKVNVEYMSEHSEVVAALVSGQIEIAILPEPNVTAAMAKKADLVKALDLTAEWDKVSPTKLVQGCIIVKKDFYSEHKKIVDTFINDYSQSVDKVNNDIAQSATLMADYGIVPNAEIAQAAIPNSNIVCVSGEDMKQNAQAMLNVLFEANPKSIGGSLPNEEFYVTK